MATFARVKRTGQERTLRVTRHRRIVPEGLYAFLTSLPERLHRLHRRLLCRGVAGTEPLVL
jgi:hypothetical protein